MNDLVVAIAPVAAMGADFGLFDAANARDAVAGGDSANAAVIRKLFDVVNERDAAAGGDNVNAAVLRKLFVGGT
jgi:hypothetical protein